MNTDKLTKLLVIAVLSATLSASVAGTTSLPFVGSQVAFARSDTDLKKAKKHFLLGSQHFEKGEYKNAADEFLKSYEFSNNPLLLFNVAKSYQEADDLINAKKYYIEFLNAVPDAENGAEVQEELNLINKALEKRTFKLKVFSDDGMTYQLLSDNNTKSSCDTPCEMEFTLGEHLVLAKDSNGNLKRFPVTIKPVADQSLNVSKSDGTTGTVHLLVDNSKLIKQVTIGNKTTKTNKVVLHNVPIGKHPISIESDGFFWNATVVVAPDKTTDIQVMLRQLEELNNSNNSWRKIVGYSAIGLGVGSAVGGVFMGMAAKGTNDILQASKRTPQKFQELISGRGKRQQLITNILYGVGGGLVGLGVGFVLWDFFDKPEVKSDVVFVPISPND